MGWCHIKEGAGEGSTQVCGRKVMEMMGLNRMRKSRKCYSSSLLVIMFLSIDGVKSMMLWQCFRYVLNVWMLGRNSLQRKW